MAPETVSDPAIEEALEINPTTQSREPKNSFSPGDRDIAIGINKEEPPAIVRALTNGEGGRDEETG